MASLKEVKNRIKSVASTRKITSAMKLVASAKLHHAQVAIESMLPYQKSLNKIMSTFLGEMKGDIESVYAEQRKVQKAVIVAYSSNSSLCGAFNTNVVKEVTQTIDSLKSEGVEEIQVIPIGAKIAEKVRKMGFPVQADNTHLLDRPNFNEAASIAQVLMDAFKAKEIDKVILIYHHFHNTAKQVMTTETFLPVSLDVADTSQQSGQADYIVEPSKEELVATLIPRVLYLKIYTALLDSCASEHAARVIAMQTATDNADEILHDLTLTYNKTRQAAITTELLDIVGGSFQ